jgi:arsenate reductase
MKQKVLFLCTNNSARSQIAEGFLKAFYQDKYDSYSAGLHSTKLSPYATEVMKEIGIDISNQFSKNIEEFKEEKFDYVVTVCSNVKESCPFFPGKKIIHINFEDPSEIEADVKEILVNFRKVRDEIKAWIIENFG